MACIPELCHLQIPLVDILMATNNFSDDNFIGEGGFGRVFKGQLPISASATATRPSTSVAVKRLDMTRGQGDREFMMEIVMLASYKHDNLASLVGFCDDGDQKIIIYKHEARGSLDNYLASDLTWVQRLQICLGAARGLNYLHTGAGVGHRVLHRDIKSSNVLLDENWEAKISDFGLSKIGPTNQDFTFLVTNPAGTLAYVDPVYVETGVLTKESDVYSFGIVLFEVLCGRLVLDRKYEEGDERRLLSRFVKLRYEEGKLDQIILPSIREQMKPSSLRTFSQIAYQCLNKKRHDRPTMSLIIDQLQSSLDFQIINFGGVRVTKLWGSGTGGYPWSWLLDNNQKLKKITIEHDHWISSVTFTTEDLSGSLHSSKQYGGLSGHTPGEITEVDFDTNEEITGIRIGVDKFDKLTLIAWICIMTNIKTHGPFGKMANSAKGFSEFWDAGSFAGFYGRAGWYMDGFGCYLKANDAGPSIEDRSFMLLEAEDA